VKTRLLYFLVPFFCAVFSLVNAPAAAEELVPRTVIALYDDNGNGTMTSYVHTLAEMPLNHLGLTVEYYDIHKPLPDIAKRQDVRGVLTWFFPYTKMKDPEAYLKWAINAIDAGKKYVVMGSLGIMEDEQHPVSPALMDMFLGRLGIKIPGAMVDYPFDVKYDYLDSDMFAVPAPYDWLRPPYQVVKAASGKAEVHLKAYKDAGDEEENSDLIITTPTGGYISPEYIFRTNTRGDNEINQWFINPFKFFQLALDTDNVPKPDTTTIAGRRIYYSHIDGDGWNNVTRLEEYRNKGVLSAQVIMDKIVKPYPDLPVTLAIIAADIDPEWVAIAQSRKVAKEFLALPQVEAGSHTYSHPFFWQFFADGNQGREIPYLSRYKTSSWSPEASYVPHKKAQGAAPPMPQGYSIPRAYANKPFDIHMEMEGARREITQLLPEGKEVKILTWSGNCSPWEEAVRLSREAGMQNINGGDSRSDPEYPGYASLAPIGRQVGKERQIYSSESNENTYTNLWSENFHAHRYLNTTLKNSETPIRLKPFNIYYHIYSGEREASLNGLISNLTFARSQDIAPVTASYFTKIAEGFYNTRIISIAPDTWRIENRELLNTIRFDYSSLKSVDFGHSKGVIGQRNFQGSLYVYLDAAVKQPVIALKDNARTFSPPEENIQYLVESRWLISNVNAKGGQLDFTAQGYGPGEMLWQMPGSGRYRISINGKASQTVAAPGRLLKFKLAREALKPLHITITAV
jgi:hypothetical protein